MIKKILYVCSLSILFFSCSYTSSLFTPLDIPEGLTIISVLPHGCEVQWNETADAEYYMLRAEGNTILDFKTTAPFIFLDTLQKGETYEVSVCACRESQKSGFSQTVSVRLPDEAKEEPYTGGSELVPPEHLKAEGIDAYSIRLSWDSSREAESYTVYYGDTRQTLLQSLESYETSISIESLQEAIEYVFKVKAVKGKTESAFSNTVTASTIYSIPAAPSIINIEPAAAGITLTWTPVSNAAEYIVYFGETSDSMTEYCTTSETAVNIKELKAGTAYYAAVKAANPAGESSLSSVVTTQTSCVIPRVPANFAPGMITLSTIELVWDPSPGAEEYEIEYGNTKSGMTKKALCTNPCFILGDLAENTLQYFKVRAKNSAGASGWTSIISAKTLLSAPDLTEITSFKLNNSTNPSSILIRWAAALRASSYTVYRSINSEHNFEPIAVCTGTQYMDSEAYNCTENTTYYYKVESSNSGGSGGLSSIVTGTLYRARLLYDVTGSSMSGYYEFYLDGELLCTEVFINYSDPPYLLCEELDVGLKTVEFRFKKLLSDEWSSSILYDPIQFSMGGTVTCKCSSISVQSRAITYALE